LLKSDYICRMKKHKKPLAKTKKASPKKTSKMKVQASRNKAGVMPLGDRVLVKPFAPEDAHKTTSFGIIIPDTAAKDKPDQGTVVAVGPGKKNEDGRVVPMSVKAGDKVMFSKYGFDEVKVNGVEYYIVSESSILAILD